MHSKLDGMPCFSEDAFSSWHRRDDNPEARETLKGHLKGLFMIIGKWNKAVSDQSAAFISSLTLEKKRTLFKALCGHGSDRLTVSW